MNDVSGKLKVLAMILVIVLIVGSFAYLLTHTAIQFPEAQAQLNSLEVVIQPQDVKLAPKQPQDFWCYALNGTAPFTFYWEQEIWVNDTVHTNRTFLSDTNSTKFMFKEIAKYAILYCTITDAEGSKGYATVIVYDPQAFTISSGVYPGAPSYMVWVESGIYYAKNAYGLIEFSGTDAATIINNAVDDPASTSVLLASGNHNLASSITIEKSNFILEGEGSGTVITTSTADLTLILVGDPTYVTPYENVQIKNLKISTQVNKTAGSGIEFRAIQDTSVLRPSHSGISDVLFENQWDGLVIKGCTGFYANKLTVLYSKNRGIAVCDVNNDQILLTDITIDGNDLEDNTHESATCGLQLSKVFHAYLTNVHVVRSTIGLYIRGQGSDTLGQIYATNLDASDNKDMGLHIWLTDSSDLRGAFFTGCSFDTNGILYLPYSSAMGAVLSTSSTNYLANIRFVNCEFFQNGGNGVLISASNPTKLSSIKFVGCAFINNGKYLSNTYNDLLLAAGISDFQVENSEFVANLYGQTPMAAYGIYITTGASDNYTIIGNSFKGHLSSAIYSGGTGTNKTIKNNIGFVTENSGTATNVTATTFSFNHGCVGTPTSVLASFNTITVSGYTWTANATAIAVTITGTGLPASITAYWKAEYIP